MVTSADHARRIEQGYALLRQGREQEALPLANALAAANPRDPHVLVLAAEANLANGDAPQAIALMERAIAASGGHPLLKLKQARLLIEQRRRVDAAQLLDEVAGQATGDGKLLWLLANACYRNNMQDAAIRHFEQARALIGDQPGLLYELALARFFSGDLEQAEHDLERMPPDAPEAAHALYLRATLRRQTPERNHVDALRARIARGFRNTNDEASVHYALAKELEDLGEHAASFAALRTGAASQRRGLQYDVAQDVATMEAMAAAYSIERMREPAAGDAGEGAIFVLGMPRSGTTLVERLLVQSGEVAAAGELGDIANLLADATGRVLDGAPDLPPLEASLQVDFAALGREYMRGAREAARGSERFIDKAPLNFLYCGAIARALPRARIIHLVRDPLDNGYALFKTLFFGAYDYACDLDDLAGYYIAYHRLMAHWHAAMPGRILDVRYEDLVADPDAQARRLYDWCGLAWDAALLEAPVDRTVFVSASAAQVREPVHRRSVGSASRHREGLAPLVARLVAAGVIDGAGTDAPG